MYFALNFTCTSHFSDTPSWRLVTCLLLSYSVLVLSHEPSFRCKSYHDCFSCPNLWVTAISTFFSVNLCACVRGQACRILVQWPCFRWMIERGLNKSRSSSGSDTSSLLWPALVTVGPFFVKYCNHSFLYRTEFWPFVSWPAAVN